MRDPALALHDEAPISAVTPRQPGSSARDALEVIEAQGRDLAGLWRNVLVLALREPLTARRLDALSLVHLSIAGRFPAGYACLVLLPKLEKMENLADRGLRAASRRLIETTPSEVLGVAEVIEGTGFRAASVRSVATGLVLATRPRWPMRVFPSVEPAAAWVTQWVDKEERAGAPRRILEALRHTLA